MADQQNEERHDGRPKRLGVAALEEVGLLAMYRSHRDVKLLVAQRFVRLFAYGASTLILAAYLSDLGFSETRIGLFMTLTLVGDVLIGFCLTMIADGLGRRKILALGSVLMLVSGVAFAFSGNYWVLLIAAVFGVISPSGNEVGPFRAVEESTLAHLTPAERRSDVFAWYSLTGTGGTALGFMVSGWMTNLLIDSKKWTTIDAYRVVYYIYSAVGVLKLVLSLVLSSDCEADKQPATGNPTETQPLLGPEAPKKKKKGPLQLLPQLSAESKIIVFQLCLLFACDSFASGLAPL
jgi:MFS family permease